MLLGGCKSINSNELPPEPTFMHFGVEHVPFNGEVWHAAEAPLPVTGGHLAAIDENRLAAADPDLRVLFIVDVSSSPQIVARHSLAGEPGRVIADGSGGVHVVLRDAAAIASLSAATSGLETRSTCASPRGIGWDADTDALYVACLDGLVQRLPRTGGVVETVAVLEAGDLRDIVPQPEGLWITHFRSARVSLVSRQGALLNEVSIPVLGSERAPMHASIAWRAIAHPNGGIVVSHQRHTSSTVSTTPTQDPSGGMDNAYGGGFDPVTGACRPPLIVSAVTEIAADGAIRSMRIADGTLPVDVAVHRSQSGDELQSPWVASAGVSESGDVRVREALPPADPSSDVCVPFRSEFFLEEVPIGGHAQAVSLARVGEMLAVQTRFPSMLRVGSREVSLGGDLSDVGHALFHVETASNLACASCHPEGGEDAIGWSFFELGTRRTQELRGGILATAPFHWNGDAPAISDIMIDVFDGRMGGGSPTDGQMTAVAQWIDALALPALDADATIASEGRTVFEREGCAECHAGAQLTNNEFADFGRGMLQVPGLLGVALRGPWMHDGCASSLESTFVSSCAGDEHASAAELSSGDRDALVTYLRTL